MGGHDPTILLMEDSWGYIFGVYIEVRTCIGLCEAGDATCV